MGQPSSRRRPDHMGRLDPVSRGSGRGRVFRVAPRGGQRGDRPGEAARDGAPKGRSCCPRASSPRAAARRVLGQVMSAGVGLWVHAGRHLFSGGIELRLLASTWDDEDVRDSVTLRDVVTPEAWAKLPGDDDADRARAAARRVLSFRSRLGCRRLRWRSMAVACSSSCATRPTGKPGDATREALARNEVSDEGVEEIELRADNARWVRADPHHSRQRRDPGPR